MINQIHKICHITSHKQFVEPYNTNVTTFLLKHRPNDLKKNIVRLKHKQNKLQL